MAEIGDAVPALRVEGIERGHITTMAAILRDPNPIHFDTAATSALGMGDREINQGPTNVGYIASALAAWAGGHGAIRQLSVRLAGNVRAGDVVTAGGRVEAIDEEDGVPVATCRVWLRDEDGVDVVTGTARVAAPRG